MMWKSRESRSEAGPHPDWPENFWEKLDNLSLDLDLDEIPQLDGALLDFGPLDTNRPGDALTSSTIQMTGVPMVKFR